MPYSALVAEHLKRHCPAVWARFASDRLGDSVAENARLELLKSTYVLTRESHAAAYAIADDVAVALGLGVPLTLYQGEDQPLMNAALVYLPDTAAVVLHGPVLDRLAPDELRALLAHELAHHRLWRLHDGTYLVAARALDALSTQRSALATQRLYALSAELFADRAALRIGCTVDSVVRTLLKVRTGMSDPVAADFLAQSTTLYEAAGGGTVGWSHPETHVRALALAWFAADGDAANDRIRALVEGRLELTALDVMRREELTAWTRRLVDVLLQPQWFRTDAVLGHARILFDDYEVPAPPAMDALEAGLAPYGESVRDYATYVLIDFVAVDPSLFELALARAHAVAEPLGLHDRLVREVHRLLKRTKKSIREVLDRRDALLGDADRQVDT